YPAPLRATGVGAAISVGRVGAIIAPTTAGWLLDAGWTPLALYITTGAVFCAAGLLLLAMPREQPTAKVARGSERTSTPYDRYHVARSSPVLQKRGPKIAARSACGGTAETSASSVIRASRISESPSEGVANAETSLTNSQVSDLH